MPNVVLKVITRGFGRKLLKTSEPQGPIVAELQDYVQGLATRTIAVPLSFESGETGIYKVYAPARMTVLRVRLQVVKALAATDGGGIELKTASGANMSDGSATLAASSPFGFEAVITPTARNLVEEGSFFQIITSKTNPGGKVLALVEVVDTPILT